MRIFLKPITIEEIAIFILDYGNRAEWNPTRFVITRVIKNFRKKQIHFERTSQVETMCKVKSYSIF